MIVLLTLSAAVLAFIGPAGVDGAASATATAERAGNQAATTELPVPPAAESVSYRVTVSSTWTSTSHPATLPSNSHFSPSVVVAHAQQGDLFAVGTSASAGIERMAETGSTGTLIDELAGNDAVTQSGVGFSIFGAGDNVFQVLSTQDADLVSVVTMLAPSPDWFVGVAGADLFVDGAWTERLVLDLGAYDAGTDSGSGFRSPNSDTEPSQPISGPRDSAFADAAAEARFGTVTIERVG